MPSNQQVDETLAYVVEHSPVDLEKLSPEGKKLVQDLREIISTTRLMVQTKNHDEIFQQFIWNTRFVDTERLKAGNLEDHLPVNSEGIRTDADEGWLASYVPVFSMCSNDLQPPAIFALL